MPYKMPCIKETQGPPASVIIFALFVPTSSLGMKYPPAGIRQKIYLDVPNILGPDPAMTFHFAFPVENRYPRAWPSS